MLFGSSSKHSGTDWSGAFCDAGHVCTRVLVWQPPCFDGVQKRWSSSHRILGLSHSNPGCRTDNASNDGARKRANSGSNPQVDVNASGKWSYDEKARWPRSAGLLRWGY